MNWPICSYHGATSGWIPDGDADINASQADGGTIVVAIGNSEVANSVAFAAGGSCLVSGGRLYLQPSRSTSVTAVAGVAATISSTIVGSGRLAATGKGTLVLANMSHRYSGGTYIEDSLLQLSNGVTLEAAAGKWKAVGRS